MILLIENITYFGKLDVWFGKRERKRERNQEEYLEIKDLIQRNMNRLNVSFIGERLS